MANDIDPNCDDNPPYYDYEGVKGFVDKVKANAEKDRDSEIKASILGTEQPKGNLMAGVSNDEIMAAVQALTALVYAGVDLKKELGIRKMKAKKRKGSKLDETIHSEEFGAVCAYVAGDTTYTEASAKIMELTGVELRAAQDFIAKRKPAAVDVVKICNQINLKLESKKPKN